MIIKSRENKLPPTNITQKFTPSFFSLLNFNEIRCKQCNENDQMASVFCYSQILYMNIRDKLFPRVKSEIQIRENFSREKKKSNIRKIKLPQKSPTSHGFRRCGNCERLCLSCNLSAFVSRFEQSRIRELRKFFGQESHRPPPPPSPKVPVSLWSYFLKIYHLCLRSKYNVFYRSVREVENCFSRYALYQNQAKLADK